MAMMSTSNPADLITQFQTLYSDKLLPKTEQLMVYDQFATKTSFPKNRGAKTMRMHRKKPGSASNVATATEGVAPSTYREIDLEYVEATLVQYVEALKFSDVLSMTELFNSLIMSRESLAEDMSLHADQIVRNTIVAGVTTNKIYAGGATTFNALVALDASVAPLTIQDLLRAFTALQIQRAPKKNGEYFAIVPPQIAYDLMLDTKFFVPVGTYQDKSNIVKGEVGKWFNVRVVISTLPFREANTNGTEGTYASTGPIYTTVVVGADAYGTPIMGGNSPYTPHIYVNDKAEKVDPANQFTIVAAKSFWAALMLQELWAVTIRSKTTYA
jgi:N4-gp56 family major capsid protein